MYLRKTQGPRFVTLPDGRQMSRGDLPDPATRRWTAAKKATIALALGTGLLTSAEARELYGLDDDEIKNWLSRMANHGQTGLKMKRLSEMRAASRLTVKM